MPSWNNEVLSIEVGTCAIVLSKKYAVALVAIMMVRIIIVIINRRVSGCFGGDHDGEGIHGD
jgi:hypothetical protein